MTQKVVARWKIQNRADEMRQLESETPAAVRAAFQAVGQDLTPLRKTGPAFEVWLYSDDDDVDMWSCSTDDLRNLAGHLDAADYSGGPAALLAGMSGWSIDGKLAKQFSAEVRTAADDEAIQVN